MDMNRILIVILALLDVGIVFYINYHVSNILRIIMLIGSKKAKIEYDDTGIMSRIRIKKNDE